MDDCTNWIGLASKQHEYLQALRPEGFSVLHDDYIKRKGLCFLLKHDLKPKTAATSQMFMYRNDKVGLKLVDAVHL